MKPIFCLRQAAEKKKSQRNFFIFFVTRLCQTCHRDNDNDTDTDETILERKNGRTRWAVQGKKHDVADAEDDDDH